MATNDFVSAVREIRGTGAPGDARTDGMYYEIAEKDYNGNAGMHGDIVALSAQVTTDADAVALALAGSVDLIVAVSDLQVSVGDATTLTTTSKEVIGAINELNSAEALNTAKVTNVTTDLSLGINDGVTLGINSSDGTDVIVPGAATGVAGLLSGDDKDKLDGIEASAKDDQTAAEIEAIITHNNLIGVAADEHIDWTLTNAKNVHTDNYTNTTYIVGDGELSEFNLTTLLKSGYDAAYTHSQVDHAPSDADNTSSNETSHIDVLVDGDFATAGLMKTDGSGNYSIDTNTYLTEHQDLSGYSLTSHDHSGVYEPADDAILKDTDIGTSVQAYDADIVSDANYSTHIATIGLNTAAINVNKAAIASLATSQGSFKSTAAGYPIAITTTSTLMPFDLLNQSNDTGIFEIDSATNTVVFKQARRYTFMSDVTLEATENNASATISFNLIDTSDDSIFHTQDATLSMDKDSITSVPFNTEIKITSAPLTLRFEVVADSAGFSLKSFNTVLASQGGDLNSSIVLYDNTISGLTAENTKDAIDELDSKLDTIESNAKDDQNASEVPVTTSGNLTSTDVQAALEELQGDIDTINTDLTTIFNRDLGGLQ